MIFDVSLRFFTSLYVFWGRSIMNRRGRVFDKCRAYRSSKIVRILICFALAKAFAVFHRIRNGHRLRRNHTNAEKYQT